MLGFLIMMKCCDHALIVLVGSQKSIASLLKRFCWFCNTVGVVAYSSCIFCLAAFCQTLHNEVLSNRTCIKPVCVFAGPAMMLRVQALSSMDTMLSDLEVTVTQQSSDVRKSINSTASNIQQGSATIRTNVVMQMGSIQQQYGDTANMIQRYAYMVSQHSDPRPDQP